MHGVLMGVHLAFKKQADKAEIIPIKLDTPKLVSWNIKLPVIGSIAI